jgi:hypothetical protein
MRDTLLTEHGLRTVPIEERGDGAEVILDAWYPHWDLYVLRFFRRNGDREALLRWLSLAETALEHLGYCPEFLGLEGFRMGDPSAWTRHGAPSNLNCATAWYRALLEVLFGLELDPGGLTVTETAPGSGPVSVRGVQLRGAQWDIDVVSDGPSLERCLVDGTDLGGCRKIPRPLSGPGRHHLVIRYGRAAAGITLEELVNAEVLEIRRAEPEHLQLRVHLLGAGEVLFCSGRRAHLRLDGADLPSRWDPDTGRGWGALEVPGHHDLEITLAKQSP